MPKVQHNFTLQTLRLTGGYRYATLMLWNTGFVGATAVDTT